MNRTRDVCNYLQASREGIRGINDARRGDSSGDEAESDNKTRNVVKKM